MGIQPDLILGGRNHTHTQQRCKKKPGLISLGVLQKLIKMN
ncbi:hypothetical protein LYNGBM3L_04940 [Moorena producens 3L]|uniref:Uncharacterized protein n=1 Tax=Moorena producens 3L TaxID=489825 RepID=F4XRX7_9CYAN|nr:hypothetical protein LYNGBM3L_04940 [Moorena producens 3L]